MNAPAHEEARELLPWLANGSLAGAELERVQAHVRDCAECRADLATLHMLRAAGPGPGMAPDCDPERALARLLPQLDAPAMPGSLVPPVVPMAPDVSGAPVVPVVPGWRRRLAANERSWLRWGTALQFGAIAILATLLAQRSGDGAASSGPYRALGAAPAAQAALIVTFRPETPERELRRIVHASGASVAGGPTTTGAWLLDADGGAASALQALRREPAVTLAEPLAPEGRP